VNFSNTLLAMSFHVFFPRCGHAHDPRLAEQ
jgi:hypothetical protein